MTDHQSACADAWLMGWRVRNQGLVLPDTEDAFYVRRMAHFRAGREWEGGAIEEMMELARTMGLVEEEEL